MGKILAIGEIMLRLSTSQQERLAESSQFNNHYGGGEANVAISLANFGHNARFASKVPANPLGTAVKQHLNKYGVGTEELLFGGERLGIYFLETGAGFRPSSVIYDRSNSSFAQMQHLEWDFDTLFAEVELLHFSGITPALSSEWRKMMLQLVKEAKRREILVNLDINYRSKLWSIADCRAFVQELAPYLDFCSAARLDALNFFEIPETDQALSDYYEKIRKRYPNIKVLYSTTREVLNAQHNRLQGNLYLNGKFYQSKVYNIPAIVDRVGAGDAFTGGVLHGLLDHAEPQKLIDFATVAAVAKHTVHGDCNQFSKEQIEEFLLSGSNEIKR